MFDHETVNKGSLSNKFKHLDSEIIEGVIQIVIAAISFVGLQRAFSSSGIIHWKLQSNLGTEKARQFVFLLPDSEKKKRHRWTLYSPKFSMPCADLVEIAYSLFLTKCTLNQKCTF